MKFLQNLLNRIFQHWQSTLFGLSYAVIFFFLYTKHINVTEAISLMTAILAFKGIFLNKDPDKTQTKESVKQNEIKIDDNAQ
jgi:hypothetical protein